MQKPTWIKVIGVLAIIFGILGVFGSMQQVLMPYIFEFQQEVLEIAMEEGKMSSQDEKVIDKIFEMTDIPEWYATWSIVAGLISMFICGYYLLSGIWFITLKKNGDKFLIRALLLSIVFALAQLIVALSAVTGFLIFMAVGLLFGIVIDIILLIVIMSNDRSLFRKEDDLNSVQEVA